MKSVVKAVTWRLIAATTTMFVVAFLTWHATGTIEWGQGGIVAAIAGSLKMVFYVFHEKAYDRFWNAKETEEVGSPRRLRHWDENTEQFVYTD